MFIMFIETDISKNAIALDVNLDDFERSDIDCEF